MELYTHTFSSTRPVCLLVGAFKVIISMYDPITVFLIVCGLFSVGLFLLMCFLPRKVPLAICCTVGLVVLNSLTFCSSGELLTSPSNWKESCW